MISHGPRTAHRIIGMAGAAAAAALLSACASGTSVRPAVTQSATPAPTPTQTTVPAPPPATPSAQPQPGVTVDDLVTVAAMMYPPYPPPQPGGYQLPGAKWATCESGHSGDQLFEACPVTPRLLSRLNDVISGIPSAPDPLGGGQQAYWSLRTITAEVTPTGGVAHVLLALNGQEHKDLVIVRRGGRLLVDDISCTRQDPTTSSIYRPGWIDRSTC
jgi:hypothetical protein